MLEHQDRCPSGCQVGVCDQSSSEHWDENMKGSGSSTERPDSQHEGHVTPPKKQDPPLS